MKTLAKFLWFSMVVLFTSAAFAQPAEPYPRRPFSQAELDQMLAPIALYPDSLLSQILMAATYPQDIAEAASWSRVRPELHGDSAVRAAEGEPWDPSVISLTAFPQVLAMMDERRDWTDRLGEAFIAQPEQVMDTVQGLRARADAAGNLRSSEELVVQRQGDYYIIEPPTPEIVYVPYYDPRYVYGNWWWPAYEPIYWRPWRGYRYYPGRSVFGWGYGVTIGSGFFFGHLDWRARHLRYSSHRPWYWRDRDYHHGHRWTHNRDHRWRDRDGRWRDRDRDGRRDDRDGRWRDRDGRWRDRDGRWREGDRDRRDRRDRPAAAPGGTATQGATAQPAPAPQGFFPPQAANPMARPTAPRYPVDAVPAARPQARGEPVHEAPANSLSRPERVYGAPQRAPAPQPAYPTAVPQQAYPAPAPQMRAAPAPAAGTGVAPTRPQAAPPAQPAAAPRPAPREQTQEQPSSEPQSAPASPMQRGGGRGVHR